MGENMNIFKVKMFVTVFEMAISGLSDRKNWDVAQKNNAFIKLSKSTVFPLTVL